MIVNWTTSETNEDRRQKIETNYVLLKIRIMGEFN